METIIYVIENGQTVAVEEFWPSEATELAALLPFCRPFRPGLTRVLQVAKDVYDCWVDSFYGECAS